MRYTKLRSSGLRVSRVAFGTWQLGGDWGPTDEKQAISAIRRAADEGVTLFDTAQAYGFGASERLLAKALAGQPRDQVVIATKGGLRPEAGGVARDASPEWISQGVEVSLRALDTDYIDLYQVHWPDPKTPFKETATELAHLVAQGKIRHVGVSNFDVAQMEAFSETLPVETLQPPYHLFRRDIETDVLPYTEQHGIGVLVYGPLAHGLLSGQLRADVDFPPGDWRTSSDVFKGEAFRRNLSVVDELARLAQELGITLPQLAVAWTLANPAVDVAIVGTRNPDHVVETLAGADVDLDSAALARIEEIMTRAVPVAGPSPEGMPRD
jgi:aryl-alcohol dehydrogenase-like predicted oxidoreductase